MCLKSKYRSIIILSLTGFLFGCSIKTKGQTPPAPVILYNISPVVVKQKLDAGEKIILLDVRQPEEYAHGHLQGAILIPIGELPDRYRELNADQEIIVYCHSGGRSSAATKMLLRLGFENVKNMKGGIIAWPYPVVK